MGTVISLDVRTGASDAAVAALFDEAAALLTGVDTDFSTWSGSSWISRLARGDVQRADLPARVRDVLGLCEQAEQDTDGWFTPRWCAGDTLDPTGLVKGWAAQQVSDLFLDRRFPDHCVNAAGDVVLAGSPTPGQRWRVGIADPTSPGALIGFTDGTPTRAGGTTFGGPAQRWTVATSGTAERGHHVIDPTTGDPAAGLLSATVIGTHAGQADAYATAVFAAAGNTDLTHHLQHAGWAVITITTTAAVTDTSGYCHPLPVP